ncbi:MAG TPA: alginate export family protein [Verrucomicrobiae bacterium]|nr:alginate export family protein [Verrucomicrobiae bacterium]
MKRLQVSLTTAALVLSAISTVYGQAPRQPMITAPPGTPPPPSAGLLNDYLREQSPDMKAWDIGGQVRLRYEDFEGGSPAFPNRDFQSKGVDNNNDFLLLREKLHVGYKSDWFGAYVEGVSSVMSWDKTPNNPATDILDLNQGYVVIGNAKEFPITLKAGRQEMIYGDERLIGNADWNNVIRVFDLVKLRYEDEKRWVDVFSGRAVLIDNRNFNVPDDYDWFSGIYYSDRSILEFQETQFYVLSRNSSPGTAKADTRGTAAGLPQNSSAGTARDIVTVGTRFKSLPGKLGNWDYAMELAAQFGSINVTGAKRVDQEAGAFSLGGGYTFKDTTYKPRLGAEYNFASGDADPNDNKNGTFDNLFPTNHKHYGYMDFTGWRNIHNPRLSLAVKPSSKLTVSLDGHAFWLADDRDLFYPQSGAGRSTLGYGRNSGYSSFVGTEVDLDATYNWRSWLAFRAGGGHFFAGDYIDQSKAALGGASDANWVYIQAVFNF